MANRRQGRELAMQFLYASDFCSSDTEPRASLSLTEKMNQFFLALDRPPGTEVRVFAQELICGCLRHCQEIDARIAASAANWQIQRIAAMDRAILRLAIYEMLFRNDIPPVVSINEAVELAKKFSTAESGKFVNGVLDHIRKELNRPARQAQ